MEENKTKENQENKNEEVHADFKIKNPFDQVKFNHWNTKYFTFFFFISVFAACLWVWWGYFYDSEPSAVSYQKIQAQKKDFDLLNKQTSEAIEILKAREEKYLARESDFSVREIFVLPKKNDTNLNRENKTNNPKTQKSKTENKTDNTQEYQEKPQILQ